ncbi:MAG TPA: tetratricopeptide repeat protein [Bryobacteraceae bacterium]|nr:tetratricopeptide repeat protein [Bryobacteraceae bacterium]
MKALKLFLCIAVLVTGVSCSRDPEVVKRKYLDSGNRYFEKGKYKEAHIMYRNALRKDRKFGEAYYRLGLTELKLGQVPNAYNSFVRAVETDPRNIDAKVQTGNLALTFYIRQPKRNPQLADQWAALAEDILKRDPNNTDGLRLRAYHRLIVVRKPEEALADFRRANEIKPLDPEITLPLVETMFALKQDAEAEKIGRAMLAKDKHYFPMYDVLYIYYTRANRPADAERILTEKVASNPQEALPLLQLAAYYQAFKRIPEATAVIQKLVDNPKDFPDGFLEAGRFYQRLRDYDTARKYFEAGAKRNDSKRGTYLKELAQVLIVQRRPNEAQRVLDDILKANPKDDDARSIRASLQIDTGDPVQLQNAVAELEAAIKENPKNAVTRFSYARALIARRQFDHARAQLQESIKLSPAYLAPRLALAELHYVRAEYGLSRQAAREILEKIDPGNLPAKLLETSSLASSGDRIAARNLLAQIMKDYPNSHDAQVQLALLDLGEKKFAEAEQAFGRLQQTDSADLRGLMGLVETYAAQKKFDSAIQILKTELAKHPERQPLRVALGNLSFRSGKVGDAIMYFNELIKVNPKAADIHLKLGECYTIQGDTTKAVASYQRARELQPNDALTHLRLGMLYDGLGRRDQARPIYEQVLKLQPDNPFALNNLAYLIAETGGDLDQALALAQRAKQRLPQHPDVADTLGWIYIKKNLSDSAIQVFRDLVSKQPARSTYRYHLGLALYQKGDKAGARRELSVALQQKPSREEEGKIKDLLGKIG